MHCPECLVHYVNLYTGDEIECPGVTCPQCAEKDAEIARLTAIQDQTANYMLERAEKYSQLVDEVIRLRALVDVGREMVEYLHILHRDLPYAHELITKWRSLEGK